ncbi:MAG: hypothetical protein JOY71_29200 [Acetobacteraceae bacterium]|nr:hypothetical protein [Acetobacteraceae bacterium]
MADKPNFILVPDALPEPPPGRTHEGAGFRALIGFFIRFIPSRAAVALGVDQAVSTATTTVPGRPRLVFGFDATASREPAWATARRVTDALVRALPGELDVALAVHGGSRLHTFTEFTANPNTLRDRAAAISCIAGQTRLLPILSRSLALPGVRVVTYIGDVYEESPTHGRTLAYELERRGIKLIVLHDTADWRARRDAELFLDLARRTGGCVLPFDASAPDRLRELLAAVAVYAVGGAKLLHEKRDELPGAVVLLKHLTCSK